MSFQPIVPMGGYAGWKFLERTLEKQETAFKESAPISGATEYFKENISKIESAEDLMNDRRLLGVALAAFGLEEDINSRYFIQKVLEDGTTEPDALANRLSDKRYAEFSAAFGFGDSPILLTQFSTFSNDIIDRFETASFQTAVGETNNDLRLALNLSSGLTDVVEKNQNENARWFTILGTPPMRTVFETALGFQSSIGSLDVDRQLEAFKSSAQSIFGTDDIEEISQPENLEKLTRLFLLRSELQGNSVAQSGSIALTLLQAGQS